MRQRVIAIVAGTVMVLGATGCDGSDSKPSRCKSPTPKAISQVLVKPGPGGGGGRPGGGGGAKPVKPKGGNNAPVIPGGGVPATCR